MLFAKIDYFLIFLLLFILAVLVIIISAVIKVNFLKYFSKNNNFISSEIDPFFYKLKPVILVAAIFFIFISLLDPRWGSKSSYGTMEGIDLVIVFDISRSMLTKDVIPDRLTEAKNIGNKILSRLTGNRVGITAFAGFAFNVLPLTTDLEAASTFINELSTDMIDIQGTNLEDAIKKALTLFEENTLTHKVMIIITDGEDYEFNPLKSAKIAKEKGVIIFTVGIGTPNGGNIPLYDNNGNIVDYLKKDGKVVVSQLNEKMLKSIAEETKGEFLYSKDAEKLLSKVDQIKKTKFGLSKYEYLEPQYQYFLLIALLLLLIYLYLPLKKINFNPIKKVLLIATTLVIFNNNSFASLKTKGVKEYKKENYEEALKYFQKAQLKEQKNDKLTYNIGNTYYKLGNYEDSEKYYNRAIKSNNKKLVNRANYNLGNLYLEKNEIDKAIEKYKEVLLNEEPKSELYKKALLNLLYAKQQQQNQSEQKQQNKNQEQQNSSKNDKNSQSSSQNNSSSSSQSSQNEMDQKPKDIENLLNLIKEEEKKYMGKKEKRKAIGINPKNEW